MNSRILNFRYVSLLILAFFPIMPYFLVSVTTGVFVLSYIFTFFLEKKKFRFEKEKLKDFLLLASFYLFICFSSIYSRNFEQAVEIILRMVPLGLFPLVLIFFSDGFKINQKQKNIIFNIFVFSCFLLLCYVFYLGTISLNNFHSHAVRDKLLATSFLDLHSTYLSVYFSTSIFILLNKKRLFLNFLVIALFLVGLVLIFSRGVIFAILIEGIFLFFYFFKIKLWKKCIFLLGSGLIMYFTISTVPFFKNRVEEIYKYGFQSTKNDRRLSSTAMRLAIYHCTYDIVEQNPVFGIGIGDVQDNLRECYSGLNSPTFLKKNLNTHNSFFLIFASSGILGFLSLCFVFYSLIRKCFKKGRLMFLSIFTLIVLILLTENFLSRSYGITFYCFFLSIFYLTLDDNDDFHFFKK